MDAGRPASYLTLEDGTGVWSSDDREVGTVAHVLADEEKDIFEGLVLDTGDGHRFVEAEQVDELREGRVVLRIPAMRVAGLPEPSANPAALDAYGGDLDSGLHSRLRRAWDLISGNY
jgi:hypothetical protein